MANSEANTEAVSSFLRNVGGPLLERSLHTASSVKVDGESMFIAVKLTIRSIRFLEERLPGLVSIAEAQGAVVPQPNIEEILTRLVESWQLSAETKPNQ